MFDLLKSFGVNEGEAFKLSLFDSKFKVENNVLMIEDADMSGWHKACVNANRVFNSKVSRIPVISEVEKSYLKIFNELGYKYLARDRNGTLFIYTEKPVKYISSWGTTDDFTKSFCELFKFITWEDDEPVSITYMLEED